MAEEFISEIEGGVRPDDALEGFKGHLKRGSITTRREAKGLPKMKKLRDTLELAQRRANIGMMVANGIEVQAIAEALGVVPSSVYKQVNRIIDECDNKAQEGIQRHRAREIAIANMVHVEAVNSFFESKEGRIKSQRKVKRHTQALLNKGRVTGRFGLTKTSGMNDTQLYERQKGNISALFTNPEGQELLQHPEFVETGEINEPAEGQVVEHGNGIVSLFTNGAQLIQFPVEEEEETETHETSPGQNEFLLTILKASDMRARLLKLYDGDASTLEETYAALTPEERRAELLKLVQDLRHVKSIVDAQEAQTLPAGVGPVIEIEPSSIIPVGVQVPLPNNGLSNNGGPSNGSGTGE